MHTQDPASLFAPEELLQIFAELPDEEPSPIHVPVDGSEGYLESSAPSMWEEAHTVQRRRLNLRILRNVQVVGGVRCFSVSRSPLVLSQVVVCVSPFAGGSRSSLHKLFKSHHGILTSATVDCFVPWSHESRVEVCSTVLPSMPWYSIPWQAGLAALPGVPKTRRKHRPANPSTTSFAKWPSSKASNGRELGLRDAIIGYLSFAHSVAEEALRRRASDNATVTPRSFLELINTFGDVVMRRYNRLLALFQRLSGGLSCIEDATQDVSDLGTELQVCWQVRWVVRAFTIRFHIRRKNKFSQEKMLNCSTCWTTSPVAPRKPKSRRQVTVSGTHHGGADSTRAQANILEERNDIALQTKQVARDLEMVEAELAAAEPAMKAAVESLQKITPADISTVRTFTRPPNLIKRIMDGVLIIKMRPMAAVEVDPDFEDRILPSWAQAKSMLSQFTFLRSLMQCVATTGEAGHVRADTCVDNPRFKKESLNEETLELLAPYLEMEDYDANYARRTCGR